jgi:hypothetical protein
MMAAATVTADKQLLRPDANGRFGKFGGKYVPETLIAALAELEQAYAEAQADPAFQVVPSQSQASCWCLVSTIIVQHDRRACTVQCSV